MTAHDTSIATAERPAADVRGPSPACLVCRETAVEVVLDLGQTAPANNFVLPEELASTKEPMFPLRVGLCRACGHVQLTDFVPPSVMFDL
jgi:hypothetical protein